MSVSLSRKTCPWLNRSVSVGAIAFFTAACGGGGGSSVSPPPPPPPANQAPNAVIETSVTTGLAALDVSFSAQSSTDADGTIASYEWDFTSDGTADATVADATFTYDTPGSFTATLTVTDNDGARGSTTVAIQVDRRPEKVAFIGTEAPSTADLYLVNDDGTNPIKLSETASAPGSRVFSFKWSPDGQWLAYQYTPDITDGNASDLLVVSVNGGAPVLVSAIGTMNDSSVGSDFAWSPDSSQIAFTLLTGGTTDMSRETYLVDRDGANPIKINGTLGSSARIGVISPRWSVDGTYIFQVVEEVATGMAEGINIFDTTLGAQNSARLIETIFGLRGLKTAPTDSRICYNFGNFGGIRQIRISDAASGVFPNNLLVGGDNATFPNERQCEWFDDGSRVAFVRQNSNGTENILIRDSEASTPEQTIVTTDTDVAIEEYAVRPNSQDELIYSERAISAGAPTELFFAGLNAARFELGENLPNPSGTQVFGGWSPDGSDFAYFGNLTTQRTLDIYVEQPGVSAPVQVTDFDGDEQARIDAKPVWSNDETRLAYWAAVPSTIMPGRFTDSNLQVANTDGSGVVILTPGALQLNAGDFAFQPMPQ